MSEERSLVEVYFRNREVDLKEKMLEKKRNIHLTVYNSEKARLKFWKEVSDIIEVKNAAIYDYNYYNEKVDKLQAESKDLFAKNLDLKFQNENERKLLDMDEKESQQ